MIMNKLKYILKIFLSLIVCALLILVQLFIINFIFTRIQNFIVVDKGYLLMTNNVVYKYGVVFVIILTSLILVFFNKKGWLNLSEDVLYLSRFVYNKLFVSIFMTISLIVFVVMMFNFDAVYENKIVAYSITNIKGITYKYEDMKEVNVKIKKYWNNSLEANYILIFDNHEVDILGTIISIQNEEDSYDHNILIDNKIKELKINKKVDDKYLDKYVSSLDEVYANKIKILFEKTND